MQQVQNHRSTNVVGILLAEHDDIIPYIHEAKKACDYLMVALFIGTAKKQKTPLINRYLQLKNCAEVDEIVPYCNTQDQEDLLHTFKIDKVFLTNQQQTPVYLKNQQSIIHLK